jgi:Zn-dependent protease with chaperone function
MVLSKKIYESFNKDELEWVLLHEAAHCIMWHVLKCAVVQAVMLFTGIFIIYRLQVSIWTLPFFSLFTSVLAIQCMKYFEYEADKYSIERVDNPQGVITAQTKFEKANPSWFYNEKNITRTLFYWNILPSQRITMAKKRMK